jgi:hypothetical protein
MGYVVSIFFENVNFIRKIDYKVCKFSFEINHLVYVIYFFEISTYFDLEYTGIKTLPINAP